MLIVCDTSPITNLIQIGQLEILELVFGQIIIPEKVYLELSVYENQKEAIEHRHWILVKEVNNKKEVKLLEKQLDAGEAEAIILAKEMNADFLMVDERRGRKIAADYGLNVIGLLGVLIQGKRKGHLTALKPILDVLIEEIGFRVSKKLYDRILREVDE